MQAPFQTKPLVHISTVSLEGLGQHLVSQGYDPFVAPQSVAWVTANKAIYVPIIVERPLLVTNLWCTNGATANSNIDIGIYDKSGTLIIASGAIAQSGTLNVQLFNITDTVIGIGDFYLGMSFSATTGTVAASPTVSAVFFTMCGVVEQASAHALPANATFATNTFTWLPIFGLTGLIHIPRNINPVV